MNVHSPTPDAIKLCPQTNQLEVHFSDKTFQLPFEYLRVFSPSAEIRGHGNQAMNIIGGKKNVQVIKIEPVGQYAIKLTFDDGHDSGLYNWETLYQLGHDHQRNWQQYLAALEDLGLSR